MKAWAATFAQQVYALSLKNGLVAWRSRRSTALRCCAPMIFLLLALIVNLALNANNSLQERFTAVPTASAQPIGSIPRCGSDLYIAGRPCIDFTFSPNNDSDVVAIVDAIRDNNEPPIPESQVQGFATRREAEAWMLAHPDGSLGGVHFTRSGSGLQYIVQANTTVKYFKGVFQDPATFFSVPMVNAVARELSRLAAASSSPSASEIEWAPSLVKFPHPSLQTTNLLGQVLSSFIFASLMFGFVTQMTNLVTEKDLGLRLALRNMGMLESSYWVSWMAFDALLTFMTALLLCTFGYVLQFDFFQHNSFGLLLLLFWLFGLAMTSYSYMLSVFTRKAQAAVYMGFSVFIVGWIFQTVQFIARLPYSPNYYYSTTNRAGRAFFWVFTLFPWNVLTKAILDLNEATLRPDDPGIQASTLATYCQYEPDPTRQEPFDPRQEFRSYDCVLPLWQVYLALLCQWAAYWWLAVWYSNILPNEVGTRRPWYYAWTRAYWLPSPGDQAAALQRVLEAEAAGTGMPPAAGDAARDEDVASEEARMRSLLLARTGGSASGPVSTSYAAELYGLRKVFRGRRCVPAAACRRGTAKAAAADFWAVRGTWLGIEEGQLFALLGPNGAGKTTTINCLTGVLPFSGGEALIYGQPISTEGGLDRVRPLMGVCPQFDVLWGELTGAEHLRIYGHVKGLPFGSVASEAAALLKRVHLSHAAGLRASRYSGGMRRRLSVSVALLGDPRVLYLDEPTTGMDPISRRHVWDVIQEAKAGRAIVLTTHSMEEADTLADRIAIIARGQLQALGSSLRLKQRYGSGYQLTVHLGIPRARSYSALPAAEQRAMDARLAAVKDFFRQGLGVEAVDETRSLLHFLVERHQEQHLTPFLQSLEAAAPRLGVADIQCALASLEEVFLAIAKRAELEAAAAAGDSLVSVDLPDGSGELLVPLGSDDPVPHPANDGRTCVVKWAQDEVGALTVLAVDIKGPSQAQAQQAQQRSQLAS